MSTMSFRVGDEVEFRGRRALSTTSFRVGDEVECCGRRGIVENVLSESELLVVRRDDGVITYPRAVACTILHRSPRAGVTDDEPAPNAVEEEREGMRHHVIPTAHEDMVRRVHAEMARSSKLADLGGKLYYSDTDSIITDVILPSSKELGALKDEPAPNAVEEEREGMRHHVIPTAHEDMVRRVHAEMARSSKLADECGALRTERDELLKENAVLRRTLERLERRAKR